MHNKSNTYQPSVMLDHMIEMVVQDNECPADDYMGKNNKPCVGMTCKECWTAAVQRHIISSSPVLKNCDEKEFIMFLHNCRNKDVFPIIVVNYNEVAITIHNGLNEYIDGVAGHSWENAISGAVGMLGKLP